MLTADTITDEQLLDAYSRKEITAGEFVKAACRRGTPRYQHESSEAYADRIQSGAVIRARVAEIINARGLEISEPA